MLARRREDETEIDEQAGGQRPWDEAPGRSPGGGRTDERNVENKTKKSAQDETRRPTRLQVFVSSYAQTPSPLSPV